MSMKRPIDKDLTNFKLYLEGVEVPFTAARIEESEGAFPNAVISVPATRTCTQILPGTIVQLSGPYRLDSAQARDRGVKVDDVLIFEGEVISLGYGKEATGRALQLQCSSLLNRVNSARSYSQDSLAPQLHKSANMIFVNANAPVGTPGNTNQTKSEGTGIDPDEGEQSDFTLSNRFGGVHYVIMQQLTKLEETGDVHALVQRVFAHFGLTDYYWSILDTSLRIRGSILAFPNSAQASLSQITAESLQQVMSMIKSGPGDRSEVYSLWEILSQVLNYIRYQQIAPAAPTGSYVLNGSDNTEGGEPVRMYMTPDLDSAPPALCNLFYPDQIVSFNYNRSFFSEPTRSISYLDWNYSKAGAVGQYGINYLIPNLKVYQTAWAPQDDEGKPSETESQLDYSAAFTPEETYQGARPVFHQLDGWITSAANKYYGQEARVPEQITGQNLQPNWDKAMKNAALKQWMLSRYGGSRTVTLQTSWNPGRLVGVPGLIMDPGFPSLYGVVQNISTEINAGGSCSSSVTFRSVRMIYDEDPDAFKSEEEVPLAGQKQRTIDMEIFPTTHDFLYDANLYSYKEIGRDIYTYMTMGHRPLTDSGLESSLKKNYIDEDDKWAVNASMFEAGTLSTSKYDYSIFDQTRSLEDPKSIERPDNAWGEGKNDTTEEAYAKDIYWAVRGLKQEYLAMSASTSAEIDTYLTNKCYRNLISFKSYLGYIQAANTQIISDYRSSVPIMATNAEENLKIILDNAVKFAHQDALLNGSLIQQIKLDWGTGSAVATIEWLTEQIEVINQTVIKLKNEHKIFLEAEIANIENNSVSASVNQKLVYTIVDGDTLYDIAQKYGTSINKIMSINTVPGEAIKTTDGNTIIAGKSIFVPDTTNQPRADSITEKIAQRTEALQTTLDNAIGEVTHKQERYTEMLKKLKEGIPADQLIEQDDVQAVYRPYDQTRYEHVISAFGELLINEGDINISK